MEDLLILLPVAGTSGGNKNRMVVTITYAIPSYIIDYFSLQTHQSVKPLTTIGLE